MLLITSPIVRSVLWAVSQFVCAVVRATQDWRGVVGQGSEGDGAGEKEEGWPTDLIDQRDGTGVWRGV